MRAGEIEVWPARYKRFEMAMAVKRWWRQDHGSMVFVVGYSVVASGLMVWTEPASIWTWLALFLVAFVVTNGLETIWRRMSVSRTSGARS